MPLYDPDSPEEKEMLLRASVVDVLKRARMFGKDRQWQLERLRKMGFETEAAAEKFANTWHNNRR